MQKGTLNERPKSKRSKYDQYLDAKVTAMLDKEARAERFMIMEYLARNPHVVRSETGYVSRVRSRTKPGPSKLRNRILGGQRCVFRLG